MKNAQTRTGTGWAVWVWIPWGWLVVWLIGLAVPANADDLETIRECVIAEMLGNTSVNINDVEYRIPVNGYESLFGNSPIVDTNTGDLAFSFLRVQINLD